MLYRVIPTLVDVFLLQLPCNYYINILKICLLCTFIATLCMFFFYRFVTLTETFAWTKGPHGEAPHGQPE